MGPMQHTERKKPMTKEETVKQVHTPHDKGYKRRLSNPREFLHFLRKYVKADWAKDLQESQLRLCDKEYIDKDYEGREADLVYEVTKADGEKMIIFILQELQSTVDYTMIFRILMYVVSILLRYFMNTEKKVREQKDFKLPAVVPIVFYNGEESWTAVRSMQDYQIGGRLFGTHVLNLEYYLVNLNNIEKEYILSTNTVLDNIMYCDKFRKGAALADAIKEAYTRIQDLDAQAKEEFEEWTRNILLSICGDKKAVVEEILSWARNGDDNMAFKYNIIKAFEDERAEGRAEDILLLLEEVGAVSNELQQIILAQKDNDILTKWIKAAARAESIEDFKEKM